MKQNKQPVQRREFDLDHVDLHSDIEVDRFKVAEKPAKKVHRKKTSESAGRPVTRTRELFFSALLNLILAGGIGYLVWDRQVKEAEFNKELASFKNDINIQAQTLKSANERIQDLEGNNKKLVKKGDTLSTKRKSLSSDVEKQKREVALYMKEIGTLKKSKADLDKKLNSYQKRYNGLKRNSKKKEKELNATISALHAKDQEKEADFQIQITAIQQKVSSLKVERDSLSDSISMYEGQIEEEAQAGKSALREQSRVVNENRTLKANLSKLEKVNKKLLLQNKDLREVTTGELVPFSSDLIMPVPHYKEPTPKGLKWPRGTNVAVVHMLISEAGSVTEIHFPQGQLLDTTFKSIISPNMFKWKFSPPRYRKMNVKAWIPVIIRKP